MRCIIVWDRFSVFIFRVVLIEIEYSVVVFYNVFFNFCYLRISGFMWCFGNIFSVVYFDVIFFVFKCFDGVLIGGMVFGIVVLFNFYCNWI